MKKTREEVGHFSFLEFKNTKFGERFAYFPGSQTPSGNMLAAGSLNGLPFLMDLYHAWLLTTDFNYQPGFSPHDHTQNTCEAATIFHFFFHLHSLKTETHLTFCMYFVVWLLLQRRPALSLQHVAGLCGLTSGPQSDSCLGMLRSETSCFFCQSRRFYFFQLWRTFLCFPLGFEVLARHQLIAEKCHVCSQMALIHNSEEV